MKRSRFLRVFIVTAAMALLFTSGPVASARAQTMTSLGTLPGFETVYSRAAGVSGDGLRVVGFAINFDGIHRPFLWTRATGMQHLSPNDPEGDAAAISADGSTVVGTIYHEGVAREAFRWTSATGIIAIGGLHGTAVPVAWPTATSSDGSTVVGYGRNPDEKWEAFAWKAEIGMVGLGVLPGFDASYASGVSADGSTVVGSCEKFDPSTNNSAFQAFIWTASTGMVGLGHLDGGDSQSFANGISGNGSTVVGESQGKGFVWTATGGMVALGGLPGSMFPEFSSALAVSSDGRTVVGFAYGADGSQEAIAWTQATGMIGLGWLSPGTWSYAQAISADGSTVVGESGGEAFILRLVPDPVDLIVALVKQVAALNLKRGIENSLDAKLDTALNALEDTLASNDVAAIGSLYAFINAVKAQSGKAISTSDANALIGSANKILNLLL